jgi:hypothetical protein
MQESLPLEHGRELIADTFEKLLDRSRVAQKRDGHLQPSGRNITLCSEHIVGNPLDEVRRILVLDMLHLLFDFLHGNFSTEYSRNLCQNISELVRRDDPT